MQSLRVVTTLALAALLIAFATPALADDQGVPPPPGDPLATQRTLEKLARIQGAAATNTGNGIFTAITGARRIAIPADAIGPDYAEITMPVWPEPQDATLPRNPRNWCGPGSTAGVVSRWSYMYGRGDEVAAYPGGSDAYQLHLAVDLNEMEQVCWDAVSQTYIWCTTYPGMVRVTNQAAQAGAFYIESGPIGGLAAYIGLLRADIHDANVPLVPVVWTAGLAGWGSYGVTHWVAVKQYWEGGNTTTYGDTAGTLQRNTNPPPYGWHVVNLDFFYTKIQQAYNSVVW